MSHKQFNYILKLTVVFIAYFVTARFGLKLDAVSGFATLVWAPTGIALAALFILGYQYWLAITLAAFWVNLLTGATPLVALGIGIGNTLEPLLGAYLLKRFVRFNPKMERVSDVLGLVILAAIGSTTVSATVGVTSLWLGHTVSTNAYGATWTAWWIGDMLGAIVAAPLIFVWSRRLRRRLRPRSLIEASAYLAALMGMCVLIFRGAPPFGIRSFTFVYIIFPVLIWFALRFGQVGSVTASFVASAAAIWGTVAGSQLSGNSLSHRLLLLQIFMGVTAVTFMVMAAVVTENERSQRQRIRLAQKAELLAQQRTQLLALNKAKDEFITLASHRLKSPATDIKVYAGLLLDNFAGKLTQGQKTILKTAYDSNEKQLETINTLLRVARFDAGGIVLNKEKVDVVRFIKGIIDSLDASLSAKHQTVNVKHDESDIVAMIDKEKFRIVLESLIDNASKYSSSGKNIDVRLQQSDSHVAIAVEDNGVGIAKEDMRKLFKKFSRLSYPLPTGDDRKGFGLYLANKIIDLHQGTIEVISRPHRGSTFTVVVPSNIE